MLNYLYDIYDDNEILVTFKLYIIYVLFFINF